MKIFNWVHRRFHHKYEVGQDATKVELTGNEKDKLALLENEALDGVFDGWKEGILAIGTFGFDPAFLKDFEHEDDDTYLCEISDDEKLFVNDNVDDDYDEVEMELPLVLKACKHGFFHDHKKDHDHQECHEILKPNDHEDGVDDTDHVKREKKAGERVTLADLFLADSENNLLNKKLFDEDHVKVKVNCNVSQSNMKHDVNDDTVSLISNKKLRKDHAARPMKKINRMMKKILKKKIHPDVENQKEIIARTKPMRIPAGSVN